MGADGWGGICQVGRCSAYTAEEFKESWKTAAGFTAAASAAMMVHPSADGGGGVGGPTASPKRRLSPVHREPRLESAVCFYYTARISAKQTRVPRQLRRYRCTTATNNNSDNRGSPFWIDRGKLAGFFSPDGSEQDGSRQFSVAPSKDKSIKGSKDQSDAAVRSSAVVVVVDFRGEPCKKGGEVLC